MLGTARTAISNEWDWPKCNMTLRNLTMASSGAAKCACFKRSMPIAPSLRPASIATTSTRTAPGAISSSTTSWAESSLRFQSEAETVAIAIHNVRLIDGSGQVIEQATVIVRERTIHAAGPRRAVSIPRGGTRIDGRGLTVLPGLIDCHVHLCLGAEPDVVKAIVAETPAETLLKAAQSARQTLEAGF